MATQKARFVKRKMTKREKNEAMWGWLFVFPTMLGLIVLNFYPILYTIYQSFFKTGDFGRGNIFVGLNNYMPITSPFLPKPSISSVRRKNSK